MSTARKNANFIGMQSNFSLFRMYFFIQKSQNLPQNGKVSWEWHYQIHRFFQPCPWGVQIVWMKGFVIINATLPLVCCVEVIIFISVSFPPTFLNKFCFPLIYSCTWNKRQSCLILVQNKLPRCIHVMPVWIISHTHCQSDKGKLSLGPSNKALVRVLIWFVKFTFLHSAGVGFTVNLTTM